MIRFVAEAALIVVPFEDASLIRLAGRPRAPRGPRPTPTAGSTTGYACGSSSSPSRSPLRARHGRHPLAAARTLAGRDRGSAPSRTGSRRGGRARRGPARAPRNAEWLDRGGSPRPHHPRPGGGRLSRLGGDRGQRVHRGLHGGAGLRKRASPGRDRTAPALHDAIAPAAARGTGGTPRARPRSRPQAAGQVSRISSGRQRRTSSTSPPATRPLRRRNTSSTSASSEPLGPGS